MSLNPQWSYREIIDGMLVVVIPETKKSYIEKYLDISDSWYASGAGKLSPIINKEFIEEINNYLPESIESKCLIHIQKRWPHFQEITAKLLNLIDKEDKEAIPLAFYNMVTSLLILLAYINETPYLTLGTYIKRARQFKTLPTNFDAFVEVVTNGQYTNIHTLKDITLSVFDDLEEIVERRSITINREDI